MSSHLGRGGGAFPTMNYTGRLVVVVAVVVVVKIPVNAVKISLASRVGFWFPRNQISGKLASVSQLMTCD